MTRPHTPARRAARHTDRWPTPGELADAPELAILAALDTTLELTVRALVSACPALADPEIPYWALHPSKESRAAEALIARTADLHHALAAYRRALAPRHPSPPSEDPIF